MGLSHLHMGPRISGPMSTTTRPHGRILALLVQELPVEEGCTSTKDMMVMGLSLMATCGSTAQMGDGPGPSLALVTLSVVTLVPISGPVLALTPRVRLLILCGVHARTVALHSASVRHRPRRRQIWDRAQTPATTRLMGIATMADLERSTPPAASAPTAWTAALGCAQTPAITRLMGIATMADLERSSPTAASAPTAWTAVFGRHRTLTTCATTSWAMATALRRHG